MFDLTGKKALITGSTQGIGFELAKAFSKHGAQVYINGATSMEKCIKSSECVSNSIPVLANLSNSDDIDNLYDKTGEIDILILNASVQYKSEWDKIDALDMDKMMQLNIKSSVLLIQKYSKNMIKNKYGRILTIGTTNQHKTHKTLAFYAATKCAQMSLVRNFAKEFAPFGITVNNICPGAILTPRNEECLKDSEFKKVITESIPCGRIGNTTDIVAPALLMCSEEGSYITGADLVVDGGLSL